MLRVRPLLRSGLLAGFLAASVANAGTLQFEDAWVPEAPPVAPVMGGYVRISNPGGEPVSITAAECPDFARVEIHDMQMRDGMMRMIKQDQLTIPADGQVELKPGGMHLMLMKPKRTFKTGETLEVTFRRDDGQSSTVTFEVRTRPMEGSQHQHHQHH